MCAEYLSVSTGASILCKIKVGNTTYETPAAPADSFGAVEWDCCIHEIVALSHNEEPVIGIKVKEIIEHSNTAKVLGKLELPVRDYCNKDEATGPCELCLKIGVDGGVLRVCVRTNFVLDPDAKSSPSQSSADIDLDNILIKAVKHGKSPIQRALSGLGSIGRSPKVLSRFNRSSGHSQDLDRENSEWTPVSLHRTYGIEYDCTPKYADSPDLMDPASPETLRRRCAMLLVERDELRMAQYQQASIAVQKDMALDSLQRSKEVLLERLRDAEMQLLSAYQKDAGSAKEPGEEELVEALIIAKVSAATAELRVMEMEGALRHSETKNRYLLDKLVSLQAKARGRRQRRKHGSQLPISAPPTSPGTDSKGKVSIIH